MPEQKKSAQILGGSCTPKVTIVERSQLEIEQFLEMLRLETCNKLEELPSIPK